MNNARSSQASRTHQAHLEALLEISLQLSRIQPLESLLERIAKECGYLLNTDSVGFRLVEGSDLVLCGTWGNVKATMALRRLKIGESLSGIAAATAEPLLVTDPANDPRLIPAHREGYRRLGIRNALAVPLKIGERVIGVLSTQTTGERGFSAEDVAIATAFASQAAIALENVRLYREATEWAEKLTTLSALSKLIASVVDSTKVFSAIADAAAVLLAAKVTHVWIDDPAARAIRAAASYGITPWLEKAMSEVPTLPYGTGVSGIAFESRVPLYIPDIQGDPRWQNQKLAREAGLHACAALPLIAQDKAMGVVAVLFGEHREFAPHEKALLSLLADQAAIAVEKARLFQEIEERRYQLEQQVRERTAQLVAVNHELEAFAHTVSHDLKAPLRGIAGFSRALSEDCADRLDDTGRHYLEAIQTSVQRMAQLIDDLLRYARAERGEAGRERVLLRPLVEGICTELGEQIRARGITVQVELGIEAVGANSTGLREALTNLVQNAVKFSRSQGGTICISSRCEGDDVILSVADTGIGFHMKYHDQIFRLFGRLQRFEEYPGTGVGLAVVRQVAERHGGRAWAVSEPGKGSTFFLALPAPTTGER